MKFFKNKVNIILTVVLLLLVGLGVFLGIKFFEKPSIKAIDFTDMFEDEIVSWTIDNGVQDLFEYEHNYDELIPSGKVIYQSVKDGDAIKDRVLIIISDGPDQADMVDIPFDSLKTLEEAQNWFKEQGFTNVKYENDETSTEDDGTVLSIEPMKAKKEDLVTVKVASKKIIDVPDFSFMSDSEINSWSSENNVKVTYKYESSKQKKGSFLKQSVEAGQKVASNSEIIITVSNGQEGSSSDSKTAYIDETKYLGVKEEEFTKALKNLGFTNVVKIDEVYSPKYAKGTICYYLPDGNQKTDTKISYKVSKGKEGESETKTAYIDTNKYFGTKEDDFVKALKDLGFTNVVKIDEVYSDNYAKGTICYYLPDGNQKLDTKISYKVSKGKQSEPTPGTKTAYIDPTKYLGVKEEVFTKALKDLGFTNIVKIEEEYSDFTNGTVTYYLPDGNQKLDTKIEYKISKGKKETPVAPEEKEYDILGFGVIQNTKSTTNYNDTANNINDYFSGKFTNVTINGVSSEYAVGTIVSISVNGNKAYTPGKYKASTPIVVEICNKDISSQG